MEGPEAILGARRGSPEGGGGSAAVRRARRAAEAADVAGEGLSFGEAKKNHTKPQKIRKNMGNDDIHARNLMAYRITCDDGCRRPAMSVG